MSTTGTPVDNGVVAALLEARCLDGRSRGSAVPMAGQLHMAERHPQPVDR